LRWGALIAPAAALVLAGCGSTPPLSATQLRATATKLCTASNRVTDRIDPPGGPAGGSAFLKRGIAALEPELAGLETLKAPAGTLSQVYAAAVSDLARELSALRTTVSRLDSGGDPVTAVKALQQQLAPLESEANDGWRALQIPACVQR
jgi:hypothetical protein